MEEGSVEEENKSLDLQEEKNTEQGHREELVELSDIKLVMAMTKDELQEYAITRLGQDLNLSEKVKLLRVKVVHLIRERLAKGDAPKPTESVDNGVDGPVRASNRPEFIFNPANRRIFEWTESLGKRIDYVPCYIVDLNGNRL